MVYPCPQINNSNYADETNFPWKIEGRKGDVQLTIYLSRVLCLSFVLSYSFLSSCHPVILSSCHICGIIYLSRVLCLSFVLSYSFLSSCHPVILSSCHICGTLSYSLCLRIQTNGVYETEGFEREGLQMER
jgi:hypothetical protein